MITEEPLDAIKFRLDATTKGRWRTSIGVYDSRVGTFFSIEGEHDANGEHLSLSVAAAHPDQDFVAHARKDVARLLAELETPTMTDEELAAIARRCDAATGGPWTSWIEGRDHESGSSFIMTGDEASRGDDIELTGTTTADQDFIAHARQDIPHLLTEVARVRQK